MTRRKPPQEFNRGKSLRLPLREIDGHLTCDERDVIAWYRLHPTRWSFLSTAQRAELIRTQAMGWTALAGHRLHRRVTHRPYPAWMWGKNYAALHPAPVDRAVWNERIMATQRHLRGTSLAEPEVFVGVTITTVGALRKIARGRASARQKRTLAEQVRVVDTAMAQFGLGAPCEPGDVARLVHRSVGLGLPEPQTLASVTTPYGPDDIAAFTDGVIIDPRPGSSTIKVTGLPSRTARLADDGDTVLPGTVEERYVAVLVLGRTEPLDIPGAHSPWAAFAARMPFRVEVSEHWEVLAGADAQKAVRRKLDLVFDQIKQYEDHRIDMPPNVPIIGEHATAVRHVMSEGDPLSATRVRGQVCFAVSGRTEDEALDRAQKLRQHYAKMQITLEHPPAQAALAHTFIPGSRMSTSAHRRFFPVMLFAAALPTLTASVGDRTGMYLGHTTGTSRTAVMWDPHRSLYLGESSGLTPVLGVQGAGKSGLIADVAEEVALSGIRCTVVDLSGPLGRLARLPHFRDGRGRHIDVLSSPPGTLSPYRVVPEPVAARYLREDVEPEDVRYSDDGLPLPEFLDPAAYEEAVADAKRLRRALAGDIVRMLLPPALAQHETTHTALLKAIRENGGEPTASLDGVVDRLYEQGPDTRGRVLAEYLRDLQDHPKARLFFPAGPSDDGGMSPALLILTMAGLVLPRPGSDPAMWSDEERLSMPILHTVVHLSTARIYDKPMWQPALVAIDEVHYLTGWPSGKALVHRLARDTRKWRTRVMVGTQSAGDILDLDVANLIGEVFVGQTDDPAAQQEAMRLLRVERGFEGRLATLAPVDPMSGRRPDHRDLVFRDASGRVERVRIDLTHKPDVLAAIRPEHGRPQGPVFTKVTVDPEAA